MCIFNSVYSHAPQHKYVSLQQFIFAMIACFSNSVFVFDAMKCEISECFYIVHCEAKKVAPFYFCNNFVKPHCILIIFGREILK